MCVALAAAALIPVIHHYQLRAAVNAYIAELKARGEPMDLAQVIPPPVPPEQNSAAIFLKATSLLDTNWNVLGSNPPPAMRMVMLGKAMICYQQPDIRGYDATNPWEDIEAALAKENEGLNLLYQIADHPTLDFNLNYHDGIDKIQMSYLSSLKRAAQRLSAATVCDLHHGDVASAVKNVRTMLALANGMSHDRLIISELVRIAIAQITLSVNWEILQSPNLTDEQLTELQHDWANLDFVRGEENALAMERAAAEITLKKWRGSHSELQNYFDLLESVTDQKQKDTAFDKLKIKTDIFRWRYWWSYPDELRYLKGYQVFLETTRSAEAKYSLLTAQREQEDKLRKIFIGTNDEDTVWFSNPKEADMHFILSGSVRSLSAFFRKVMRAETAKQISITAIALNRYQLKHGNYPPNLGSLVPEFISSIPRDPVDGQPLRYRPKADGTFLLYSVGENGKDDSGDPSLEKGVQSSSLYWQNTHALDWVWPQPATEEEIQKFFEERGKSGN